MDAPRAFRLLGTAFALLSSAALAQPGADASSAWLGCASIDDDGRRLECFDKAAAAALRPNERRRRADAERDARAPDVSQSSTPQSSTSRSSISRSSTSESSSSESATIELRTRSRRAPTADDRAAGTRQVTIVEVRTGVPGRTVFVTSDGAELVQTSGPTRLFLPDVPFEAALRRGAVGGLFLVPGGSRAGIRVSLRNPAAR